SEATFPPQSSTRVTFERDPGGQVLAQGTNVESTYVPLGCTFSTSVEGSYVSVNNYNVGGPSGGQSCATHNPRFQGEITIRFCLPGNVDIPAGVTRVGLWVA